MRTLKISGVVAAAVVGMMVASSQAAVTPPSKADLTMGKWELNVAKSKFTCSTAPKASQRHFFDAGWGMMVAEWTGTNAEGKPTQTRYVWRYDGGKYPSGITGPDAREALIYKLTSPTRVDFVHVDKADKVTSTYYREVSADGQTMTQSTKYTGRDCEDLQVFERR